MIHGQRAHRNADGRELREHVQHHHQGAADPEEDDLLVGGADLGEIDPCRSKQMGIGLDGGAEDVQRRVLEQQRHPERGDQDRQQRLLEQRPVGEGQDADIDRARDQHREQHRERDRERDRDLVQAEGDQDRPAREGAHHGQVAVGEVDQADDAVDDRVAEGHQRVEGARGEAVDRVLDEVVHRTGLERRLVTGCGPRPARPRSRWRRASWRCRGRPGRCPRAGRCA